MPELPEVETVVRGLRPKIEGRQAGEAWVDWPKVLGDMTLEQFNSHLMGRNLQQITRRGKYICMDFGGVYVVVHLRMTGRLYVSDQREGLDRWVHFSLSVGDNQWLNFSDARKFGRVTLHPNLKFLEAKLGPEPLTLTPKQLSARFESKARAVKAFLLDQKNIAGVGNIYADESLWQAKIHPMTRTNQISKRKVVQLSAAIIDILQKAIDYEGASISWYRKPDGNQGESQKHFNVYGRQGQPCPRCATAIEKTFVAQRGTHYCPKCQKR